MLAALVYVCYSLGFSCMMWSWTVQLRRSLLPSAHAGADRDSNGEIGSCWITASSVAGAGRYHVKEVGKFVGRKRQGSARHLGKRIHLSTRRYEKWLIFLHSHANRLWGDWRSVEYGQLQKKSMDSLLWVYWIVRPPLSQTGHLNKEHFWIYLLFVIKCP